MISKSEHTLRQFLRKGKTTTPEAKGREVIYKVPCADCNCVYDGKTGQSLEVRLKEHKYAVKPGDTKNGIAVHAWSNERHVDWDATKVRAFEQPTKRKVMESLLIDNMHTPSNRDNGMNLSHIWKPLLT